MTTNRSSLLSCGEEYYREASPHRVLLVEIHGQKGVVLLLDELSGDEEGSATVWLSDLLCPWELRDELDEGPSWMDDGDERYDRWRDDR